MKFARNSTFEGVSLKLDYLTKPSFLEDFGFGTKVKMADRVRPEDELFVVAYPYFNVNGKSSITFPPTFNESVDLILLWLFEYRDACCGRTL